MGVFLVQALALLITAPRSPAWPHNAPRSNAHCSSGLSKPSIGAASLPLRDNALTE